jgi:hypothetical protein
VGTVPDGIQASFVPQSQRSEACIAAPREAAVAEVLITFSEPIQSKAGDVYIARACGAPTSAGTWEGWVEFVPAGGGEPIQSGRETTQPNRTDAVYWASGLAPIYLEGALERALRPAVKAPLAAAEDVPATPIPRAPHSAVASGTESVLNPFSVFRKGEALLRRQLAALSRWHLVNIIVAHDLSQQDAAALSATPDDVLVELIVSQVRARSEHFAR